MLPVTKGQRLFYAVIFAAALLVAVLGFFAPKFLASIFTWMVLPPLHAGFVGAIYLFGAVFIRAGIGRVPMQTEISPPPACKTGQLCASLDISHSLFSPRSEFW